jgi:ribosomal protein L14
MVGEIMMIQDSIHALDVADNSGARCVMCIKVLGVVLVAMLAGRLDWQ